MCFCKRLICIKYNYVRVDMNWGVYGNYFLFYFGAFSGIFFYCLICKIVPSINFILEIGKNTMVIFPLHPLVFSFLTGILVLGLKLPFSYINNSLFISVSYTIITIIILIPFAYFLCRHIPCAVGMKS